jgi:hypothetical protein
MPAPGALQTLEILGLGVNGPTRGPVASTFRSPESSKGAKSTPSEVHGTTANSSGLSDVRGGQVRHAGAGADQSAGTRAHEDCPLANPG